MNRREFLLANTPVTRIIEVHETPSATTFICSCGGDICTYVVRGKSERTYMIYEK